MILKSIVRNLVRLIIDMCH